jgi:putative NADPH-quinone reductase
MKNCLIVFANPTLASFSGALADNFRSGIEDSGNSHSTINLYQDEYISKLSDAEVDAKYKNMITQCDSIAFVFPWWWEMPPYPMAAFLQTIFVNGFAYSHNGVKTPLLDIPTMLIVTLGQEKKCNLNNLHEAMDYCGLRVVDEVVCAGVNPRMASEKAEEYKQEAYGRGRYLTNYK